MLYSGALVKKEGYERFWVILEIVLGVDNDEPELYAFGNMVHGDNRYDHNSYEEMLPLNGDERLMGGIKTLPSWQLKKMVD